MIKIADDFGQDVTIGDRVMWRGKKKFAFGFINKIVIRAYRPGQPPYVSFTVREETPNSYYSYPRAISRFVKV